MIKDRKFKDQYLGKKKIMTLIQVDEAKTPLGNEIIKIVFESKDFRPIYMPKKSFEMLVTETPIDENSVRDILFNAMVPGIVDLIKEYDVPSYQLVALFQKIGEKIQEDFEKASCTLWTGNSQMYDIGMDYTSFINSSEVQIILNKIPKVDETGKKTNN